VKLPVRERGEERAGETDMAAGRMTNDKWLMSGGGVVTEYRRLMGH
jgi:hypothetical protein